MVVSNFMKFPGSGAAGVSSTWGRPNSRITSRHFADGKPPGQGFRQKYLANSVVFRGGLNKISEVGCTPHHRVGSGRPEPAWGQTASDPDLPLGTSSCATVLDALETQVGFADSASLRQTSGLLRRRFWIRCALWGCRVRLTPKGTPERGRLKNGRLWNGSRPEEGSDCWELSRNHPRLA